MKLNGKTNVLQHNGHSRNVGDADVEHDCWKCVDGASQLQLDVVISCSFSVSPSNCWVGYLKNSWSWKKTTYLLRRARVNWTWFKTLKLGIMMTSAHRLFLMNVYVKSFQLTLICEIHPCAPVSNETIVLESGNVVTFCSLLGNSMYLIDVYDSADLKWSLILCILINFLYRIHWWYHKSGSVIALLWWLPIILGCLLAHLGIEFHDFLTYFLFLGINPNMVENHQSPLFRSEKSSEGLSTSKFLLISSLSKDSKVVHRNS